RLRAAFGCDRFIRDLGIARLLLKTGIPRELSPRFEFALLLLEGSRPSLGNQNAGAGVIDLNTNKSEDNALPYGRATAPVAALLFKGCVTEGLFARVNRATARVLAVNGCSTNCPSGQVCCGALHAHAGDLEGARVLARQNVEAFEDADTQIITNAGGCGAMLVSYGHLLVNDEVYANRAKEFSARVQDISQHLRSKGFRNGASIGFERTTYDASCHLLHGQHAADASLQMLWAIPDLNFALLRDSDVCCGGAGVYNLMEPELSEEVLSAKLECI